MSCSGRAWPTLCSRIPEHAQLAAPRQRGGLGRFLQQCACVRAGEHVHVPQRPCGSDALAVAPIHGRAFHRESDDHGGWEREGGHYRAGLNSIPLLEFRRNPDDVYLLGLASAACPPCSPISTLMGRPRWPSTPIHLFRSTIQEAATTDWLLRPRDGRWQLPRCMCAAHRPCARAIARCACVHSAREGVSSGLRRSLALTSPVLTLLTTCAQYEPDLGRTLCFLCDVEVDAVVQDALWEGVRVAHVSLVVLVRISFPVVETRGCARPPAPPRSRGPRDTFRRRLYVGHAGVDLRLLTGVLLNATVDTTRSPALIALCVGDAPETAGSASDVARGVAPRGPPAVSTGPRGSGEFLRPARALRGRDVGGASGDRRGHARHRRGRTRRGRCRRRGVRLRRTISARAQGERARARARADIGVGARARARISDIEVKPALKHKHNRPWASLCNIWTS